MGEALLVPFQEDSDVLGVAGAIAVQDCGLIGYAENILGFPGGGLRYAHHAKGHTGQHAIYRRATVRTGKMYWSAWVDFQKRHERVARMRSLRNEWPHSGHVAIPLMPWCIIGRETGYRLSHVGS